MTSYHAQSGPARATRAARAPARRRRPRARHRCRHAGASATRAASWWRPGPREGGRGRADPGRVGGPRGGRRHRAWPGRAGRSRGSCRGRAASAASGSRGSRPTSAARSCSRRPAGSRRRCATSPRRAAATGPAAVCRELTKLHETIVRGSLGELAAAAARRARSRPAASSRSSSARGRGARDAAAAEAAAAERRSRRPGPRSSDWSAAASPEATRRAGWRRRPACRAARLYGAERGSASIGRMTAATERQRVAPALPILGQLSMIGARSSCSGRSLLSVLAIVLDFGLHADQTVALRRVGGRDPRPRLGGRPVDRAARRRSPARRSAASSTRRSATSPS